MKVESFGRPTLNVEKDTPLGNDTRIFQEGLKIILAPGEKDTVFIQQLQNQLQITVNGKEKAFLNQKECKNFEIRGLRNNVRIDPSVSFSIRGISNETAKSGQAEGLAMAKQQSAAFRAAMAKESIDSEFKSDPFLGHISNQLQKLAQQFGVTANKPMTSASHRDLLPLMNGVSKTLEFQTPLLQEKTSNTPPTGTPLGSSEPFQQLLEGLAMTLNQYAQRIQQGEAPDLNTLGSQLTEALQRFQSGTVSTGTGMQPPAQKFELGEIPVEGRKLPPGMDQKKAAEKSKELNEAIAKNDIGKLRDLANDKETMAIASPQEKASIVNALSQKALASGKDEGERDRNREAINKVLQSAGNPAEYKSIMNSAGPDLVQQAILSGVKPDPKTGIKDPKKDKEVADFNVTAGALSSSEYATDPEQAKLGTQALAKGYTPDQIIKARQEMHETRWHLGRKDDDLVNMADKPLNMLVSTTSEKADMINQLNDGWPNSRGNRATVSILQSAQDKGEFDQIVAQAGGPDIGKKLHDDEARKKFDTLAGAYERVDLANDKKQAHAAFGALTDPAKTEHYLGGATSASVPPGQVNQEAIQARNAGDPLGAQTDAFIASNQAKIQSQVSTLDRKALVDSVVTNIDREKEGKPMINPQSVRQDVDAIMNDSRLNEDQKEEKIEELRKKKDISEYTMRNIATQPISHIYNHAAEETGNFAAPKVAALEENVKRAEARFGKESPQAAAARNELQRFQSKIGPYASHLQQVGKTLGELYPPPKEWYEKLADFFLGIFKNFAPMLLNLIPGVGSALYGAYQIGKSIYDMTQDNFLGAIGGIAGAVPGLGEVMGGAGEALKMGAGIVQKGASVGKAIASGDVLGAIGGAAAGIPGADSLGPVSDVVQRGAGIAQGIATGNPGKVLDEIGSLAPAGSTLSEVSGFAKQGLETVDAFRKGDFTQALNTIGGGADGIGGVSPSLLNFANQGSDFINQVSSGNYSNALQSVASSLNGADPLFQQVGSVAQQGATFFSHFSDGSFASNLGNFGLGLGGFSQDPAVTQVNKYLTDISSLMTNLGTGNHPQFIQQSMNLISNVSNGDFRTAFQNLGTAASGFGNSPGVLNTVRDIQAGSTFLNAILNGSFVPSLTQVNTAFANQPGVSQVIERALHMTIQGSYFLKALINKDFNHQFPQLIKRYPGRTDLKEAQSTLLGASGFFGTLGNGRTLQSFDQYQQQLRSIHESALLDSMLRDFEREAKKLAQNRDLQRLLAKESDHFQINRTSRMQQPIGRPAIN